MAWLISSRASRSGAEMSVQESSKEDDDIEEKVHDTMEGVGDSSSLWLVLACGSAYLSLSQSITSKAPSAHAQKSVNARGHTQVKILSQLVEQLQQQAPNLVTIAKPMIKGSISKGKNPKICIPHPKSYELLVDPTRLV
jgi:hypothetical protein